METRGRGRDGLRAATGSPPGSALKQHHPIRICGQEVLADSRRQHISLCTLLAELTRTAAPIWAGKALMPKVASLSHLGGLGAACQLG